MKKRNQDVVIVKPAGNYLKFEVISIRGLEKTNIAEGDIISSADVDLLQDIGYKIIEKKSSV
jgi:hypothetical protein